MRPSGEGPNPVDVHVGRRVRMRRAELRVSQQALAEQLDVSFQQVQKYERGSNRISASKLFEISQALAVPISYFFEGLSDMPGDNYARAYGQVIEELMAEPNGPELAEAFLAIRRRSLRKELTNLVQAIAANDAADDEGDASKGRSAAE